MELTISSLLDFCLILAIIAFASLLSGTFLAVLFKSAVKEQRTVVNAGLSEKLALISITIGSMSLTLLILTLIWAGSWWLWNTYGIHLSPGKLALFSLVLGPAPLLLAVIASAIAKLIGGDLDASRARECKVLGVDIGGILYFMFMAHWVTIFTGGLAILGLIASGIWALVSRVQ